MGLKEEDQAWTIKPQTIEDLATGLTLHFEIVPDDPDAPFRLKIVGDLPFGNREIRFGQDGKEARSGMVLSGLCKPTWLMSAEDYPVTD
jgi:hypothetical protein